ncbi:FtsX-like permease family protein [Marinoscillum sp.]|uniref:FtsX-like permease family protein n=1 Tax=Marinoscillum sp. TaxID=2024838 RepID=UPI003BAC6794
MKPTPPKYALRFLRWYCHEAFLEEIEGDVVELFELRCEQSPKRARQMFWWDVIKSFRPINLRSIKLNNWTMNSIRNYTKIYFRRFRKEPTHYLVNTLGLALGFAVLFFILMYVYDEQHIDTYHTKSDRIYRVLEEGVADGDVQHYSLTANPLAAALKEEYPEIEETSRMIYMGSGGLRYEQNEFQDRNYVFADDRLFNILDFNVTMGDPHKEFGGVLAVALNQTCAQKLFGEEDPIGKLVDLPGKMDGVEVIAVYEDMPVSSTYQFNTVYISHFDQFPMGYDKWFEIWDSRGMTTWALFKENTTPATVMDKREGFMAKYYPEELRPGHQFYFQPIGEMHLGSSHLTQMGMEPLTQIQYANKEFVSIILLIGILVIVIASLNYINLSSVQALKRTLEAGIRKINGATIGQLRFQLFTETFLTLMIAYVLSLVLLVVFHQSFLDLSQKQIPLAAFFTAQLLTYHLVVFVLIWLLSSLIPALYYSKLNRSLVLKKNVFAGKGELLRKCFVVIQYGVSMCLIIGSMVLYRQLNYVQSKDLGFKNEHLLTLDINSGAARSNFRSIVDELKKNSNVINASASSRVPGEWKFLPSLEIFQEKGATPISSKHFAADKNWLDTYSMELIAGANFSGNPNSDTLKVILNQTAVKSMGLENAIGQNIWVQADTTYKMQVIGVVKDFHFESLRQEMSPMIITSWNNPLMSIDYFTIHYMSNTADVLDHIEKVQKMYDPQTPAEINFLDERWERYYQADQSRSYLILVATIISILVSVFGLFGLVNFTVERKTKEVGIRKVLGASIPNILRVVLKDYVLLLLIALCIAAPVAYYFLNSWLSDFAYRIDLSIWLFLVAFVAVICVSFITVISRVLRLAKTNPVKSLRYE